MSGTIWNRFVERNANHRFTVKVRREIPVTSYFFNFECYWTSSKYGLVQKSLPITRRENIFLALQSITDLVRFDSAIPSVFQKANAREIQDDRV